MHPLPLAVLTFALGLAVHSCEPSYAEDDAALLLARVVVNEAGFHAPADHRAIAAITVRQARIRSMPLDQWIKTRFTRALAPASERRDRAYIAGLHRGDSVPAGWREDLNAWADYAPHWSATLQRVESVIARGGRGECLATTWGSPTIDRDRIARMLADGWVIVDCGDTSNTYLRQVRP